ncbi:hypothetical protein MMC14_001941 [Varicellaria rhodocarpa]|nr:hypothetical protein [Varicellaria rhodocarpa]
MSISSSSMPELPSYPTEIAKSFCTKAHYFRHPPAVTVSCLPSFKVLFTHHSPSAYNANQSPSGSSRFSRAKRTPRASTAASCFSSRLSRTPRGAIRLEPLDHKGLEAGEDLTNAKGGVEVHIRQMGHTAGAEGLNARERSGAESQEDILPKVPENGVHVRNDFYMTSEPV